jgi:hypothetical protein
VTKGGEMTEDKISEYKDALEKLQVVSFQLDFLWKAVGGFDDIEGQSTEVIEGCRYFIDQVNDDLKKSLNKLREAF